MLDNNELAVGQRRGVGGAWMPVEQRHFAEDLPGMNDVEHDVTALCRGHADLDRTGQHAHEPGANITLGEDDPAPRYPALLHVGGKTLDYRRGKRTK